MDQFYYAAPRSWVKTIPASRKWGWLVLMILFVSPKAGFAGWERVTGLPSTESPVSLARCAGNPANCYYAATPHGVYENKNTRWQSLFTLPDIQDAIVRIDVFDGSPTLWVQTEQAIYKWDPATQKSTRIYASRDEEKKPVSFFVGKEKWRVGTAAGIWVSRDEGRTWQKDSGLADHLPVSVIRESSVGLFFSANGDWRLAEENTAQTVLKLFDFHASEENESYDLLETPEENFIYPPQTFFDFIETDEKFYLATAKGVFQSRNGFDWEALSGSGLRASPVKRIFWNSAAKQLAGFTGDGFFTFDAGSKSWKPQNDGLAKTELHALLPLASGRWISSNPDGLWEWRPAAPFVPVEAPIAELFNRLLRLEPSARDIHRRVIRYSNTGNMKIKRWHMASRLAAIAPSISLGKDYSDSNNIDIDRAGTNDADRFIEGPREKDRDMSLDFSWDLGDFLFSSAQTSIDSREKLMVDLRNDLLSEATRLYYERRRLQAEIIHMPAPDEAAHMDRLLRLDELTALIDALTDGYLSKQLEKICTQNPEFQTLWRFSNKEQGTKNKGENE